MKLLNFSEDIFEELAQKAKSYREHLHLYPELSGKEIETSTYIEKTLRNIGFSNIRNYSNHGISVVIPSTESNIVVGLRAETDALPIEEANEVEYCSKYSGVMHACGHDVHVGIMLALAELFYKYKELTPVGIKFIFQPSEETLPGGAKAMIAEGVLTAPEVNYMLGMHVAPEMKSNLTGFRSGMYMASSDEIFITLLGKGGHAAMPHIISDPVACGAQIITSSLQVINRRTLPEIPSILSFGKFIANGKTNIIPDVVEIEGTFRTFDEKWRQKALSFLQNITKNLSETAEITSDIKIINGYPVMYNNEKLTAEMKNAVTEILGDENVKDLNLKMTSDDFAYYSQLLPSCYFRIGSKDPDCDIIRNLHTPLFDVHEKVYITGIKALAACISLGFLKREFASGRNT